MSRLRHDLNFLSSVGLLGTGLAKGVTGLVADVWDLNDFWYHTVSGYAMGAFALLHVWLNWDPLVGYARFRLTPRRRPAPGSATSVPIGARAGALPESPRPASRLFALAMSRRGLFKLGLAGAGGWVLGRGLRPAPPIEAGSDVGVIF